MLHIVTIVLDGMPFITHHHPIFRSLQIPWKWYIAEGAADNTGCTSWCKKQPDRISTDGTAQYLDSIGDLQGVYVIKNVKWPNKLAMFNHLLAQCKEPGVLLEVDSDEVHSSAELEKLYALFQKDQSIGAVRFPCRYWVGPDLVCFGENCWSNRTTEWLRAWRFAPGDKFTRHEPPMLSNTRGRVITQQEARAHGLGFEHYAYATEAQCAYKEKFYGYTGLVSQWKALQQQRNFPQPLRNFFPFVDGGTMVARI